MRSINLGSRNFKLIIAIVVGLVFATGSFFYLRAANVQGTEETIQLPVPKRDIAMYEKINPDDLKWKEYPKGADIVAAIKTPDEIAGMTAIVPLYKDIQISRRSVTDEPEILFKGKYIISVNTDSIRSAGVVTGDIVDVYWVASEQATTTGRLIARNAKVVTVSDQKVLGAQAKSTGYVQLAIRPEEAPYLVPGAIPADTHVVLVKKPNGADNKGLQKGVADGVSIPK